MPKNIHTRKVKAADIKPEDIAPAPPIASDSVAAPVEELLVNDSEASEENELEHGLQLLEQGNTELSLVGGVSTDQLRQSLIIQTEQRSLIKAFIQHHLVDGVDYGRIHVVKDCPEKYTCKKDYHFSKRTLFKPGQEKIFSLFNIRDKLEKDAEAYEMLGNMDGLVAFKCTLYRGDKEVGHGRGAAVLGDQRRDANSTIKIAEKRARMDACLSLGFSEYFAQDLDDADYKAAQERANEQTAAEAAARDKDDLGLWKREAGLAMDNNERTLLFATIKKLGYEQPDVMLQLLDANGVKNPQTMNSGTARELIRKFRSSDYVPIVQPMDEVVTTVPDAPLTVDDLPDAEPKTAISQEPDLIVDEDLKNYVMNQASQIGLSGRGQMWLYQKICRSPFARWEKMDDAEWRNAFTIIQGMLDGNIEVPDEYILGYVPDEAPTADLGAVSQIFPGATRIEQGV